MTFRHVLQRDELRFEDECAPFRSPGPPADHRIWPGIGGWLCAVAVLIATLGYGAYLAEQMRVRPLAVTAPID